MSARQLEQITGSLSEHDWQVLAFVADARLATGRQLALGLYHADRQSAPGRARVARRHLKRLSDWRVLDPLPMRAIGGARGGSDTLIYGVGPTGARLLARRGLRQKRLGTPGARYVDHTLACTQLVVDLRVATERGELELIAAEHEPACWRSYISAFGAVTTLKPDLYLRVALPGSAHELRVMCEVDMNTEALPTIRAKAERHLDYYRHGGELREHGVHPLVIWLVPTQRRAEQITSVLQALSAPADRLFSVCLASETVAFLAAEAPS